MSTINSMLQDSQGYVWLATEAGLNRYDGECMRQFRRDRGNPRGLASDYVWSIAEDAQGDLWLATDGGGVLALGAPYRNVPAIQARSAAAAVAGQRYGAHVVDRFKRVDLGMHEGSWSGRT